MLHALRTSKFLLLTALFAVFTATPARSSSSDLATANAHLKRAEANLKLVDDAIGHLTEPPKGSAGRLAGMRLEQAHGDLKPAGEILGTLKEGQGLKEAVERYNRAVELHDKLHGILTGKKKDDPEPKPEPQEKGSALAVAPMLLNDWPGPATSAIAVPHSSFVGGGKMLRSKFWLPCAPLSLP